LTIGKIEALASLDNKRQCALIGHFMNYGVIGFPALHDTPAYFSQFGKNEQ
jgi:hypothetical protein